MRLFSKAIAVIVTLLLRREWNYLSLRLEQTLRRRSSASFKKPSQLAQELLISGEDHRFFRHGGIDLIAVGRVLWRRLFRSRWEGASTIEMQIVRVLTGKYERTFARKLKEMALATLISRIVPKRELPSLYLEIGYFGWRMNGYTAARRRLNGTADLSIPWEVARLVAKLKYPQPRVLSISRQNQIERRARHLLMLWEHHAHDRTYKGFLARPGYAG